MSEALQEYVDSGCQRLRVDRLAGIIRGVKLLGLDSKNGRRYREDALAEAVALYEGAKVNINHPKGHPLSPRDYQDRLGVIRRVHLRGGEGLFGDLHFNPKHALSEQLVWDSEHAPQNVGLSHNVLARVARDGDETVVEAITKVQSIDLVADPATTTGLFEHASAPAVEVGASSETLKFRWDELTLEHLELHRPDLLRELRESHACELDEWRRRVDGLAAREAALERRWRIAELFRDRGLPLPGQTDSSRQLISEQFMHTLMTAEDDKALEKLVNERVDMIRAAGEWIDEDDRVSRRPRSRDQSLAASSARRAGETAAQFAAALRGS
jgi:hypothetical protein